MTARSGVSRAVRFLPPCFILLMMAGTSSIFTGAQCPCLCGGPWRGPSLGSSDVRDIGTDQKNNWIIFGHVTTLNGEPVEDAAVRVAIPMGGDSIRIIRTDVRGRFRTEFSISADLFKTLPVKFVATKPGYLSAKEGVTFGPLNTWGAELVVRPETTDADVLPEETLVSNLAPWLRSADVLKKLSGPTLENYRNALDKFIDHDDPDVVPILKKVANAQPNCYECRTVLGLALFRSGSVMSGNRQIIEAAGINSKGIIKTGRFAEPLVVLGVIETWHRHYREAAGLLMRALEINPTEALGLQEMGRVLLLRRKWRLADDYLEKALGAGATPQVHLLRARALMGQGYSIEAEAELNAYLNRPRGKELPIAGPPYFLELIHHLSLTKFGRLESVVDQPLAELIRALPELDGIEAASGQEDLRSVLQQVGEGVETFFQNFQNTISTEVIRKERLSKKGETREWLDEKYNYLLLAPLEKSRQTLDEYRLPNSLDRSDAHPPPEHFMSTLGFASASIPFHPVYQSRSSFRFLGSQVIDGRRSYVLAFVQRPDAAALQLFGVDGTWYPYWKQGLAWIDPVSKQILRMRTDLLTPLPRARLHRLTTEMDFRAVHFKEKATRLWLPHNVTVTMEWKGQLFRNRHRYSEYKRFDVETRESHEAAQARALISTQN